MKTVAFAAIAGTVSANWAPAPMLTGDSFMCPTTGQDYKPTQDVAALAKDLAGMAGVTYQCKGALYAVKDIAHELMYCSSYHAPVAAPYPGSWHAPVGGSFGSWDVRNTRKFSRVNTRQANTRKNTDELGSGSHAKVGGGADYKNGGAHDIRGNIHPGGQAQAPARNPAPAPHAPAPAGPAGPHGRGLMWSAPSSYDAEYAMKQQAALQIKLAKAIGAAKVACGELAEELQVFGAEICSAPSYGSQSYSWAPSSGRMLGDAPVATAYSMTSPYGFSSVFEKCPKEIQSVPTATVACVVGLAEQSTPVLEALKGTQLFAAKIAQEAAMLAASPCKPVALSGGYRALTADSDVAGGDMIYKVAMGWAPEKLDCATRNCQLGALELKLKGALAQACALTAKLGAISEKFECFEAPTATYTAPWQPVAAPAPTYSAPSPAYAAPSAGGY